MADDFETHPRGTSDLIATQSLQIAAAVGLLEQARCPNLNCDNNGTITGSGLDRRGNEVPVPEQCQWCWTRNDFIAGAATE